MNPFSKSEWMTPAAVDAVSPAWIVQARTSFSLAVKNVRNPEKGRGAGDKFAAAQFRSPELRELLGCLISGALRQLRLNLRRDDARLGAQVSSGVLRHCGDRRNRVRARECGFRDV